MRESKKDAKFPRPRPEDPNQELSECSRMLTEGALGDLDNSRRYQDELLDEKQELLQNISVSNYDPYKCFSQNVTETGMIQATIYHIRQLGENIYNPDEKEKYYSDDFLLNERHVNEKVEEELVEFKMEIDEKVASNDTRNYKFPRMQ